MSSRRLSAVASTSVVLGTLVLASGQQGAGPRFFPDDPITVDRDATHDLGDLPAQDLSETLDFLEHTFARRGDRSPIRALNVNTIDEVPDSSWFTNRIGQRPMSIEEIVRGPDRFERLDAPEWVIVDGKGPSGFQPGFRAIDPRAPKNLRAAI